MTDIPFDVAPCPECYSLNTQWDEMADEEVETGYCSECKTSFSLSETIVIAPDDLDQVVDQ